MINNEYYRDFCVKALQYDIDYTCATRWTELAHYSDANIQERINDIQTNIKRANEFYEKRNSRMLRYWYNCLVEDFRYCYPFLYANRQYFLDVYGEDLMDLDKKCREKIAKIVESGKIKTDSQFHLVEEYVSEICQVDDAYTDIDKLNALLLEYEERMVANCKIVNSEIVK